MQKQEESDLEVIVVESTIHRPSPSFNEIAPKAPILASRIDDERFDYNSASI